MDRTRSAVVGAVALAFGVIGDSGGDRRIWIRGSRGGHTGRHSGLGQRLRDRKHRGRARHLGREPAGPRPCRRRCSKP